MKYIFTIMLCICAYSSQAQIVEFADSNFKKVLLMSNEVAQIAKDFNGYNMKVDANDDGEIQLSEALQVGGLLIGNAYPVKDFTGLESFSNLKKFESISNPIQKIDLSKNLLLEELHITGNTSSLKNYDVSKNTVLKILDFQNALIETLDISQLSLLTDLYIDNTNLTELDFSKNSKLRLVNVISSKIKELDFSLNPEFVHLACGGESLEFLNLKNGLGNSRALITIWNVPGFLESPNLKYICVDEIEQEDLTEYFSNLSNCLIGTYCSFTPGGIYYTVKGENKIDLNANGCDVSDIPYPNLRFDVTKSGFSASFFAGKTGQHDIGLPAGSYFISPEITENPDYFSLSPSLIAPQFPEESSPYVRDICLTPNGEKSDLEAFYFHFNGFLEPGQTVTEKIIYRNKGNVRENGIVTFEFDDNVIDFQSAVPAPANISYGKLEWNFSDLNPFEEREIQVSLRLNSPMDTPPLNEGDLIDFMVKVESSENEDLNARDNFFTQTMRLRSSWDPNDITCLQGDVVQPDYIGQYVYYRIRFENLGTANAHNVVITNMLNPERFIPESFVPLNASHDYIVKRTGNKFEYIFENIELPFDDDNNDGYIIYKVRLREDLTVGMDFTNEADIFFDYNFPVATNEAITSIQVATSIGTTKNEKYSVEIYPNPTDGILNIRTLTESLQNVRLYDITGQQVLQKNSVTQIDISPLASGVYLLEVSDSAATYRQPVKIIKK